MQLALNKATNDLYKPAGGGVTRVDEARFVVQQVQSRLSTFLGEWSLNPTVGWISLDIDFRKGHFLFDVETRARVIILETEGVLSIYTMELDLHQRVLTLTFTAATIYGDINFTVPWSLDNI